MKRIAIAVLLLVAATAHAQRSITNYEPSSGFSFAETTVVISGVDLVQEPVVCHGECGGIPCPVRVLFGDVDALVLSATKEQIVVRVPPQPSGSVVPITIFAPNLPELRRNGFLFSEVVLGAPELYEGYLLPLTTANIRGGQWETRWTIYNESEHTLYPLFPVPSRIDPPLLNAVAPFHTIDAIVFPPNNSVDTGALIYIPKPLAGATEMELRTRIFAHADRNLGVELPIVPLNEFRSTIHLLGIPTDARYRGTLRVYGATGEATRATVRVYRESEATPVEEYAISLAEVSEPGDIALFPSYAQLDPLTATVRAAGTRVRIAITTEDDVPLWAMFSFTNNTTQQATLITPSR